MAFQKKLLLLTSFPHWIWRQQVLYKVSNHLPDNTVRQPHLHSHNWIGHIRTKWTTTQAKQRGKLKAERKGKYKQIVRSITTSATQTTTHVANTRSVRTMLLPTEDTSGSKRAPDVSGHQEQSIGSKTPLRLCRKGCSQGRTDMGIVHPQPSNRYNHIRKVFSNYWRSRFKCPATSLPTPQISLVNSSFGCDGIFHRKTVIVWFMNGVLNPGLDSYFVQDIQFSHSLYVNPRNYKEYNTTF